MPEPVRRLKRRIFGFADVALGRDPYIGFSVLNVAKTLDVHGPGSGPYRLRSQMCLESALSTPGLIETLADDLIVGTVSKWISPGEFLQTAGCNPTEGEVFAESFQRHGSDKSTTHDYHLLYASLFHDKKSVLRIVEIGIGTNKPRALSTMGRFGIPGASLRAFAELFPSATITGGDIDPTALLFEDRIDSAVVDQCDPRSLNNFFASLDGQLDLVVDDGLHTPHTNLNTIVSAFPYIRKGGWLVIEDCHRGTSEIWQLVSRIVNASGNSCFLVAAKSANVVLIRKN